MHPKIRNVAASAFIFLFASSTQLLADTIHYHNLKYGTEITFPTGLFFKQEEIPLDGSGMVWSGKDDSSLAIYTMANALVLSKQEFAKMAAEPFETRDVKVKMLIEKNTVALSGNDNGQLFHMKYLFDNDDIIHGLIVKYPAKNAAPYAEYLDEIAASLTVKPSN